MFNRTIVAFVLVLMEFSITLATRPQEPRPQLPYSEQEVIFSNKKDHIRLAGTLTLPLSRGPFPAAVLCTDSGPHDRNADMFGHRPFLVLADRLTRLGIAVLRVDDRGVGESTGSFTRATSEDFAADTLAAVEYLKTRKEIDRRKIGLLGHGEGGLIAPMVAAQSRDVAFLVMMAGPGLKGDHVVVGVGGVDLDTGLISDKLIAQIRTTQERIFSVIKQQKHHGGSDVRVRKEAEVFREIATRIKTEAPRSQRKTAEVVAAAIESQVDLLLSRWFRFYLSYDPWTALTKVRCPVLAVNGEKDVQVPAKQNLERIRDGLEAGGNSDYTVVMLPKLNHLFQTAGTGAISEYAKIEETMSGLALDTISNWILERTN